jgi:hypothetical protein
VKAFALTTTNQPAIQETSVPADVAAALAAFSAGTAGKIVVVA